MGREFGADGDWEAGDRYLEFWNLVFMQYELENVRSKEDFDIVGDLPKRNIDTGMGLERVAFLLQGVDNIYETDDWVASRALRILKWIWTVRPSYQPG